jgi:hypothetical protein
MSVVHTLALEAPRRLFDRRLMTDKNCEVGDYGPSRDSDKAPGEIKSPHPKTRRPVHSRAAL